MKKKTNYFLVSNESFLNLKENSNKILWQINFFPLAACLLNLIGLILTKDENSSNYGRILYMAILPGICLLNFFLLYINKQKLALFNGIIILPIVNTIIALPLHMPFAFTFPLGFGIAAFFLYVERRMINLTYIVCAVCMFVIAYNDLKNPQASTNKFLFIFNYINFSFTFYLIINFLRYIILGSKKIIEREQEKLANQNIILEEQNSKIQMQFSELVQMNKQQLEYSDFSNKITSIVSHDIKIPMNFIANIFKSYCHGNINSETFLNFVPSMEKEIVYANKLFDEMLIWSKEQSIQSENGIADLNLITEDVCQSYLAIAQNKGIEIINELNIDMQRFAKTKYYKIILRNLLTNAIKFTNFGGEIKISVCEVNDEYKISVSDNGIGISNEMINKIKNRESIQSLGINNEYRTGYGLIFCLDLIQKEEGKLSIESKENEGSTFSFTVPIFKPKVV